MTALPPPQTTGHRPADRRHTREPGRRGRPANPAVRAGIMAAALELFAERGYDATSVTEVVERAGVTKGALYHYFSAKEDLLYEIYRDHLDQQMADLERILSSGDDPVTALHNVVENLVVTTITHLPVVTVFGRDMSRLSPQRFAALQADWRRYQEGVRGLIKAAQNDGTFAGTTTPEIASWIIFGFTNSLPLWYQPDGPLSPAGIAAELNSLVRAAMDPNRPEGISPL